MGQDYRFVHSQRDAYCRPGEFRIHSPKRMPQRMPTLPFSRSPSTAPPPSPPTLELEFQHSGFDFYKAGIAIAVLLVFVGIVVFALWRATADTLRLETMVAGTTAQEIDSVLDRVQQGRAQLLPFVGQPCNNAMRALADGKRQTPYLRAIILVNNGQLYCSSTLGKIDFPLSVLFPIPADQPQYRIIKMMLIRPEAPVAMIFIPSGATHSGDGLLYMIDGTYFEDMLRNASHFGMDGLSISSGNDRMYLDGHVDHLGAPVADTHASTRYPMTVAMHASVDAIRTAQQRMLLMFLPIALTTSALLGLLAVIVLAPQRRLLRTVRLGLKRKEFFVHYQPLVSLHDGQCAGIEALLRWNHPRLGPIGPGAFIGTVEADALIVPVTQLVLDLAYADLQQHEIPGHLHLAVNLAPRQLRTEEIVSAIERVLKQNPQAHYPLILEVTERHVIEDPMVSAQTFEALKALGIRVAIDDFGTDKNTIAQLQAFRFDYLKIDQRFVAELDHDRVDLIQGMLAFARHLRIAVIAEGVETERQHRHLCAMGVEYAQGFYYGQAMSAAGLKNWLSLREDAGTMHDAASVSP